MSTPTWAVVATAREPFPLLAAFAAHYVHLGASEVLLYLDQPTADTVTRLSALPRVTVIDADPAYFLSEHSSRRPGANMRRQRLNALHAYRTTRADWLLHVDADEFLRLGALPRELAALPDDVVTLSIPNGERALVGAERSIFSGVTRRLPSHPKRVGHLFGPVVREYALTGFSGHTMGKSITRTGLDLRIGIHAPLLRHKARAAVSDSALICHFDGLTPLHWAQKLWRYVGAGIYDQDQNGARHRYLQMKLVAEASGAPARIVWLHDQLKRIPPDALPAYLERGLVEPTGLNLERTVVACFGRGAVNLTPDHFDDLLIEDAGPQAEGLRLLANEIAAPGQTDAAEIETRALDFARAG